MTRAAFISSAGDPFLIDFSLHLWQKHWENEIDTMYIGINNYAKVPLSTMMEFLRKWEKHPKIRIIYTPIGIGPDAPIAQMLLNSKEDSILLLEEDTYIFTSGVVNEWFTILENGMDLVIGSPRYAAGEVAEAAKQKYILDYSGVGDKGFGWWPSFFVCKREHLLQTDLNFGGNEYLKGQYFKELDHTMLEDCYTDTFAWASLQLRYQGLTEYPIPQNHTHPTDFEKSGRMYTQEHDNHEIKYLHGGSLSSGWGGYLNVEYPPINTEFQKKDIETRVAFWEIVSDATQGYDSFKSLYKEGLERLIVNAGLDRNRIQIKYNEYKRLMNI